MKRLIAHPYGDEVLFTRSQKEWRSLVRRHGDPAYADVDLDGCNGITYYSPSGYIVGVFADDPGTMAHECAHVALSILDGVGADVQEANQEPFCYLLGYLVSSFSKAKP